MTVEVHTENGIEHGHDEDPAPDFPRVDRIGWVVLTLILIAVVGFFVLVGSVDASAPGGCGGG